MRGWGGHVIKTFRLVFETFLGSQDNFHKELHGKGLHTGLCVPGACGASPGRL